MNYPNVSLRPSSGLVPFDVSSWGGVFRRYIRRRRRRPGRLHLFDSVIVGL